MHMQMIEIPATKYKRQGFVRLDNDLIDALIVTRTLTKREYKVILLIKRLTEGCHTEWARLTNADFNAASIDDQHITPVKQSLKDKGIIEVLNGSYRIVEDAPDILMGGAETARHRLRKLVGQHLPDPQNGKPRFTKSVRQELPNREDETYQFGNYLNEAVDLTKSGDVISFRVPTDTVKDKLTNTVKDTTNGDLKSSSYKRETTRPLVDPRTFEPQGMAENYAKQIWQELEADKPDSFTFYLKAFKNNDPFLLLGIAQEIRKDATINNKGAVFVSRVKGLR